MSSTSLPQNLSEQLTELRATVEHRNQATGQMKAAASRKIKSLTNALNEAGIEGDAETILSTAASLGPDQPADKVKLADLEATITAQLKEQDVTEPTTEQIAALGDLTVEAGGLDGYKPERWGQGRWISAAVLKRISVALKPAADPKPNTTTKKSKSRFDRQLILDKAADSEDAEQLAKACGYDLNASFRRRISWLVTKDGVLDERFLSVKERPSNKQQPEAVAA